MNEFCKKIFLSHLIIKSIFKKYKNNSIAVGWNGGKESTVLLHMIKRLFGTKSIKIIFGDSRLETDQTYEFIKKISKTWKFHYIRDYYLTEKEAFNLGLIKDYKKQRYLLMKKANEQLNKMIKINKIKVFFSGERRGEHEKHLKFKKKRFGITFVYPLWNFTEKDIWYYILKYKIPYSNQYSKGFNHLPLKIFLERNYIRSCFAKIKFYFMIAVTKLRIILSKNDC